MELNDVNSNGENVVSINLKLLNFFLIIVEIEFKMKIQSISSLKFFQVPSILDFPYLSLHS